MAVLLLLTQATNTRAEVKWTVYDPRLASLPDAQGWRSGAPAQVSGSIESGILKLRDSPIYNYAMRDDVAFSFNVGFTLEATLKVINSDYLVDNPTPGEHRSGFSIGAYDSTGLSLSVGITSKGIYINNNWDESPKNGIPITPFDTTSKFHEYRLQVSGNFAELYIDDALFASISAGKVTRITGRNSVFFGDVSGKPQSVVDVSLVRYAPTAVPIVTVSNAMITEGDSATTHLNFPVVISRPIGLPVSLAYATIDATATVASADYLPTNGFVTIPPGQTSATIRVMVLGDTLREPDEFFLMRLSNPTNARLELPELRGTIVNDDSDIPTNTAPVLLVPESIEMSEDEILTKVVTVGDAQTGPTSVKLSFRSSDPILLPADHISVEGATDQRTIVVRPAPDQFGAVDLEVTATDPEGVATNKVIRLTVQPVNDEPVFRPGPEVVVTEDSGGITVPAWAQQIASGPTNESGEAVRFELFDIDRPSLFSEAPRIAPDGTLSFATATNATGIAIVKVRLVDDGGTSRGGIDRSPPVTLRITVNPVNDPPTVALVKPSTGAQSGPDVGIELAAIASDSDGRVSRVEFLVGGIPVGEDSTAPFAMSWDHPPTGEHVLTARAWDDLGASTTSEPVWLRVLGLPVVAITKPKDGAIVALGSTVAVQVAIDNLPPDASVTNVVLLLDGRPVRTDAAPPWDFDVLAEGPVDLSHFLVAEATDSTGRKLVSAPVQFEVRGVCAAFNLVLGTDEDGDTLPERVGIGSTVDLPLRVKEQRYRCITIGVKLAISVPPELEWVGLFLPDGSDLLGDKTPIGTTIVEIGSIALRDDPLVLKLRFEGRQAGNAHILVNVLSDQAAGGEGQREFNLIVEEAPQLWIERSEATLTISWPAAFLGFQLEASSVSGPNAQWLAVIGSPRRIGDRILIDMPPGENQRYFRLRDKAISIAPLNSTRSKNGSGN
ncbi:MAG: hypothetical protein JNK85_29710 [Verrucomicrobiales bacterium]|nr:hypothetical protein [Verrucomicrobiales bacterium]